MKAALILFAALASSAQAQTVGVHLFSHHGNDTYTRQWNSRPDETVKYNNKNFGAYYIGRDGWMVGAYKNSYRYDTFYAGYMWDGPRFGPVGTHVAAAFATGYETVIGIGKLRPMVMPSLTVKLPASFAVRYAASPARGGLFQHISLEKKF